MKKFDIILQAGQSNAEGVGRGAVENPFVPSDRTYELTSKKNVTVVDDNLKIEFLNEPFCLSVLEESQDGADKIANFSLSFATLYRENFLQRDRDILVIRAAVGGTGFKKGHWTENGVLYLKMLEMIDYALSLNSENRLVAFLWHQGEHDAFEKNEPDTFKAQLKNMILSVRQKYGVLNLPFIAGDFASEWKNKNLQDCIPIVERIKSVISEVGHGAFVQTSDLLSNNQALSNGDDIHFCRASQYELGKRYFAAFKDIVSKK